MKFYDGKYEVSNDQYNWILTEWTESKKKDGTPTRTAKRSFHPNLKLVVTSIQDRELKKCTSIGAILDKLRELEAVTQKVVRS